ncbi:hypothetical protein ACEPAG_6726 [Sanghuangporus baumii]
MIPRLFLTVSILCFCPILIAKGIVQEPVVTYTKLPPALVELHLFPTSTTALLASASEIYVTYDEGRTWKEADLPPDKHWDVTMHPYDNRFALLSTLDGNIYRTSDRAMTWQPVVPPAPPSSYCNHFTFHFKVPGVVLFNGKRCVPSQCGSGEEICYTDYYITRDGFSSEPTLLLRNAQTCLFAHSLTDIAEQGAS